MNEDQKMDRMRLPQHAGCLIGSPTINLGQHTLELLEDGGVLLIDHTTDKEVVQLDREESYRLLVTLQATFQRVAQRERNDEA